MVEGFDTTAFGDGSGLRRKCLLRAGTPGRPALRPKLGAPHPLLITPSASWLDLFCVLFDKIYWMR
jgi:hypothetical protein